MDLVKFYVRYVQRPNIFDNYGIHVILHKKCKKKKNTYLTIFFLTYYSKQVFFFIWPKLLNYRKVLI